MFNKTTWSNVSSSVSELWQQLENTISMKINLELAKILEADIKKFQVKALAKINYITGIVHSIIRDHKSKIDNATIKAHVIAYKKSVGTINNIDDELADLGARRNLEVDLPKEMQETIKKALDLNTQSYSKLLAETPSKIRRLISDIILHYQLMSRKIPQDQLAQRRTRSNTLHKALLNQTQKGIDEGFSITYKDGKKFSFKAYMEMSVRTNLQNEAMNYMEIGADGLGVEFFIASSHTDCADDHVDWQGKLYLGDRTKDEWNGKYKTIGEAKENGFATRPNCRHYFLPITREQFLKAIGDSRGLDKLKQELKTEKGAYDKKQADALKRQREIERKIRKYKARSENAEKLLGTKGLSEEQKLEAQKLLKHNKALVRNWQEANRSLIKNNDALKRDYRRETSKVVVQDLGAKYQIKYNEKLAQGLKPPKPPKIDPSTLPKIDPIPKIDPKPLIEFKVAKTTAEASRLCKDRLGVEAEYRGFNIDTANAMNKELTDIVNDFGKLEALKYLGGFSWNGRAVRSSSRVRGAYSPHYEKLFLKKISFDKMEESAKRNKQAGWWSSGEGAHVIRHELGHALEEQLYRLSDKGQGEKADAVLAKIDGMRKKLQNQYRSHVAKDKSGDLRANIKRRFYGSHLSEYGMTDVGEFIAESFAEYLGGNPRPIAKEVVETIKEALK